MMGGMGRGGKRQNRGQDLRYNLEITLEEAFNGRSAEIKVPTMVACDVCAGSGAEAGSSAGDLPHLRRPRQGARHPGLLHHRAQLLGLPRHRQDHPQSLQGLPWRAAWCRRNAC